MNFGLIKDKFTNAGFKPVTFRINVATLYQLSHLVLMLAVSLLFHLCLEVPVSSYLTYNCI